MNSTESRVHILARGALIFTGACALVFFLFFAAWNMSGRPAWLVWPGALTLGLGLISSIAALTLYVAVFFTRPDSVQAAPDLQVVRRNPRTVLVEPPIIDGVTLYHWLVQRHPREHREGRYSIWGEVTTEFFDLELADVEIRARFNVIDDMAEFQGHFLSALNILTNIGLTIGVLDAMERKHTGLGITGPEFDRTVLNMVKVLDSKKVPDEAIQQLGKAVAELRPVIVAPSVFEG
jgi:hypothetical protein